MDGIGLGGYSPYCGLTWGPGWSVICQWTKRNMICTKLTLEDGTTAANVYDRAYLTVVYHSASSVGHAKSSEKTVMITGHYSKHRWPWTSSLFPQWNEHLRHCPVMSSIEMLGNNCSLNVCRAEAPVYFQHCLQRIVSRGVERSTFYPERKQTH